MGINHFRISQIVFKIKQTESYINLKTPGVHETLISSMIHELQGFMNSVKRIQVGLSEKREPLFHS